MEFFQAKPPPQPATQNKPEEAFKWEFNRSFLRYGALRFSLL